METGRGGGPLIQLATVANEGIDVVEHLLVVAVAFGELAIVVAERVLSGSPDWPFDGLVAGEELASDLPRPVDHLVEAVPREQEEAVITRGPVQLLKIGRARIADVDGGDEVHLATLGP